MYKIAIYLDINCGLTESFWQSKLEIKDENTKIDQNRLEIEVLESYTNINRHP